MPKKRVRKVFKESARKEIKALRAGKSLGGRRKSDIDPQAARAAAGGRLPDALFKRAQKGALVRELKRKPY